MAQSALEPTTTPTPAPVCHGEVMREKRGDVTGRVFHQCVTCLQNDYSIGATRHN